MRRSESWKQKKNKFTDKVENVAIDLQFSPVVEATVKANLPLKEVPE